MLQKLSIRNYALIDSLDIEFDKNLNIITGETGAGKSIILGALSLILGQRAESKYFFNQNKKCVIEGTFILSKNHLKEVFETQDLDYFEENTLRREISIDGKSRSFINDTPVNLTILKLVGEHLIDIHSQHATREINDANFQLLIIDALSNHPKELANYKIEFKQLKKSQQRLNQLIEEASDAKSRQDYEQFLFNELEQAKITADEQEELETNLKRLNHAEQIKTNLYSAYNILLDSDHSALNILKESLGHLSNIEKFDDQISTLTDRLRSVLIELKDIGNETLTLEQNTNYNLEQIEYVNNRLDLIFALQQKHRVSSNQELLEIQNNLELNLKNLISGNEDIANLKIEISKLESKLLNDARILSSNRKNAIKKAEQEILHTLHQIGMPNTKINFNLSQKDTLTIDGLDTIQLLFSANAGQDLAPISKVASGGELSRLMLSIKTLLAKHTSLPTIIFDEIDTGISGETALKVGQVLNALGDNMQIISISHLPQIAAKGNSHFFVYKQDQNGKTTTGIKKLTPEERVPVIAEMLSGLNPGTSAINNAKELLNN